MSVCQESLIRKDSQSTKLERTPQSLVKVSSSEL